MQIKTSKSLQKGFKFNILPLLDIDDINDESQERIRQSMPKPQTEKNKDSGFEIQLFQTKPKKNYINSKFKAQHQGALQFSERKTSKEESFVSNPIIKIPEQSPTNQVEKIPSLTSPRRYKYVAKTIPAEQLLNNVKKLKEFKKNLKSLSKDIDYFPLTCKAKATSKFQFPSSFENSSLDKSDDKIKRQKSEQRKKLA